VTEACSVARNAAARDCRGRKDVDLIAEERSRHPMANHMLFSLLNEMDGLGGGQ